MTLNKAKILSIVKDFFAKKGLRPLLVEELVIPKDLKPLIDAAFQDGKNIIVIHVIADFFYSYVEARNTLEKTLMKIAPITAFVEKVYIAVPELYASESILNARILRESGIGVLKVYEEGGVEELIPAVSKGGFQPLNMQAINEFLERIKSEIGKLYSQQTSILENINNLTAKIKDLERRIVLLEEKVASLSRTTVQPILKETPPQSIDLESSRDLLEDASLPSFMRNNPWINELRKRGRERP